MTRNTLSFGRGFASWPFVFVRHCLPGLSLASASWSTASACATPPTGAPSCSKCALRSRVTPCASEALQPLPRPTTSCCACCASAGWHPVDGLRLLPDTAALEGRTWGVVRLSVCNLHSRPDHSSEMLTQALLGMPVRVLQRDDWYRVQTPDGYIAWVHRAGVQPMTAQELSAWNRADKLVVTALFGLVYSLPDAGAQPVSDVVSGNRLELLGTADGFYHVRYPRRAHGLPAPFGCPARGAMAAGSCARKTFPPFCAPPTC